MTKKQEIDITKYDFGEKAKEKYKSNGQWSDLDVWQTPKYIQSKKKAVELIESKQYGLDTGDFWILKNKGGSKLCYTGLIISHNGCLKINDKLESKLKFSPSSAVVVKDEGVKDKVMSYINEEQGVYEFGEISSNNCKNDYPYAMLLKRLMDRVILKNSKVGFFGIYSEAESDDFKDRPEEKENAVGFKKEDEAFEIIKTHIMNRGSISELEAACTEKRPSVEALSKPYQNKLKKLKEAEIKRINGDDE